MTYKFSHKIGEVLEVRPITITEVYGESQGARSWLRSESSHFNKCRVRWSDGAEEFVTCSGDYSVGDRVAIVWEGDRRVTDLNLNTNTYKKVATPENRGCLQTLAGFATLVFFLVLGFLMRNWLVALAGIPVIVVGVIVWSRWHEQRWAALNSAMAEYLQSLK